MTKELEAKLRKTQRRMLRSILQRPRRIVLKIADGRSSSSDDSGEIAEERDDEVLEPWHEWAIRATREAENLLEKLKRSERVKKTVKSFLTSTHLNPLKRNCRQDFLRSCSNTGDKLMSSEQIFAQISLS